jgi:hypothetical protein
MSQPNVKELRACDPPAEWASEPIARFFDCEHLPPPLRDVSSPFRALAMQIMRLPKNAERSTAMRKLLEAKDCAVRAALPAPANEL